MYRAMLTKEEKSIRRAKDAERKRCERKTETKEKKEKRQKKGKKS
jgi:hypothetical protein